MFALCDANFRGSGRIEQAAKWLCYPSSVEQGGILTWSLTMQLLICAAFPVQIIRIEFCDCAVCSPSSFTMSSTRRFCRLRDHPPL